MPTKRSRIVTDPQNFVPVPLPTSPLFLNLIDQEFTRLRVMAYAGNRPRTLWLCMCVCGNAVLVHACHLRGGTTTSCGCHHADVMAQRCKDRATHGATNTKTYKAYRAMIARCINPNAESYKDYGGRGIWVDPSWIGPGGFETFLSEMGICPPKLTIERRDNNGPYTASNCYWATMKVQNRNRRSNRMHFFRGKYRCIAECAEISGSDYDIVQHRVYRGWDIDRACNTPVKPKTPSGPGRQRAAALTAAPAAWVDMPTP